LCLLFRWFNHSEELRFLYAACFVNGLSLCVNVSLAPASFGFPFIVLLRKASIGRDLFLVNTLFLGLVLMAQYFELLLPPLALMQSASLWPVYCVLTVVGAAVVIMATVVTRAILTEWKVALICAALCAVPLWLYGSLPFESMTNPPVNWGYARTTEGF